MSWYNPLSWGANEAEKYDPDSERAQAARTFSSDPNRSYDVMGQVAQGRQATGAQLDQGQANQARSQQQQLASSLNGMMAGQGPSAAGMAGAAQRDSNLQQAAALQSGRRGMSAGTGIRMAGNQATIGNQQAAQTEAIGRANEMAQARGELGNLTSNIRSQDLGSAGQNAQLTQSNSQFNAQLGQGNSQYNAANAQQAALANQAARLGISGQELAARQHQGDMEFTNLDPGSTGYFADIATAGGNALGGIGGNMKGMMGGMAKGGVVDGHGLPHYGGGVAVGSTSPSYQLQAIGQRRTPVSKGDLDQGRMLAKAVIGFSNALAAADAHGASPDPGATGADPGVASSAPAPSYATGPMTSPDAGPVTSPSQVAGNTPSMASSGQVTPGAIAPLSVQYPHAVDSVISTAGAGADISSLVMAHGGIVSGHGRMPHMGNGGVIGNAMKLLPLVAMFLKDGGVVKGGGPCYARGGIIDGPKTALVGEAGPEAIVDIKGVVDRPTVTTLGSHGRAQAVIPLSPERKDDRTRVLADIVRMLMGSGESKCR